MQILTIRWARIYSVQKTILQLTKQKRIKNETNSIILRKSKMHYRIQVYFWTVIAFMVVQEILDNFSLKSFTHGCISLTTLFVKHYNDFFDRRSSGRDRDEATANQTLFYSWVFSFMLMSVILSESLKKYQNFQKKARNQLFPVFFLAIFETETHQLMYLSHFSTIYY